MIFKPQHIDKYYNYKNSGRIARIKQNGVSLEGKNCELQLGTIQYEYAKLTPAHHFMIVLNDKKTYGFAPEHVEMLDAEPH